MGEPDADRRVSKWENHHDELQVFPSCLPGFYDGDGVYKVRFCFFPKSCRYGNDTEPWSYPFVRSGDQNDLSRPNYEFFRNFDRRVRQLRDMGIQADVILFHPYDKWGYAKMGRENDDRYLRYLIARLSAYRNVWWSMANEYDLMIKKEEKTLADFDRFFQICRDEDPISDCGAITTGTTPRPTSTITRNPG